MKVEIEVTERTKRVIDVEFPVFVCHSDGGEHSTWDTRTRLDQDGTLRSITETVSYDKDIRWELSIGKVSTIDYGGYLSLKSREVSTAEAFDAMMNRFHAFMARFIEPPKE